MIEAGVYYDLSNADYHGGPGDSKSDLDRVRRSLLHYKANKESANDNHPTADQAFGTAFHTISLEPDTFWNRYALEPEGAPRRPSVTQRNAKKPSPETIEAIEFWDKFETDNVGKTLIEAKDYQILADMMGSLSDHPAASSLLGAKGYAEASAYWRDPKTDLLLRCRPDFWREDGIIVDVKTTVDASLEEFSRSVAKWRYHVQAAFYLDGLREAVAQSGSNQSAPTEFVFLAIEKKPPYAVGCYVLDDESMRLGRAEYRADLERLAEAKVSDVWPGYGATIQRIGVPLWYSKKAQEAEA